MFRSFIVIACATLAACSNAPAPQGVRYFAGPAPVPSGVSFKEVNWFSEQVRVAGRLFLPVGFSTSGKIPAVVLAPAWEKDAETLDVYAIELARQGIAALSIDYRGWGRSGAELYLGERVDTYDKMRFSEQTPQIVFRRGRLDPEQQVQDIRNALTFLDGQAGIDRAKLGVLGVDIAGGHVISVMSLDARARVGVAVTPVIFGQAEPEKSFIPDAATQAQMIRLAREGAPPKTEAEARARNAQEAKLTLLEYKPFWRLDAIPATDAIRFITAGADDQLDNMIHARAAAHELKCPNDVQTIPNALHTLTTPQVAEAARLAAEWMKQKL